MTNSWAMLHEEMEEMRNRGYEMTADGIWMGREHFTGEELCDDWMGARRPSALNAYDCCPHY